jgi:hypothetical protein
MICGFRVNMPGLVEDDVEFADSCASEMPSSILSSSFVASWNLYRMRKNAARKERSAANFQITKQGSQKG